MAVREKGSQGINDASKERGDNIHVEPGQLVHQECRCVYTNVNRIAMDIKQSNHLLSNWVAKFCFVQENLSSIIKNSVYSVDSLPSMTARKRVMMLYQSEHKTFLTPYLVYVPNVKMSGQRQLRQGFCV